MMKDPTRMAMARAKRYEQQGHSPQEAEALAVAEVAAMHRADQESDARIASMDAAMAQAMGQDVGYGNGAEIDNLAGAATPISVEPVVGRFASDATGGLGNVLASRQAAEESAAAASAERYAADTKRYNDTYGQSYGPDAKPPTEDQAAARQERRYRDDVARHSPYLEERRIRRMADAAGVTYAEAEAMVNRGYQSAGAARQLHPDSVFQVGGQNDTVPPDFGYFRDAYKELRERGRDRRAADLAARKAEVTRRAMERYNPTALLNDEWRQYVMASSLLGQPAGASPTDVDKAHNEQLTALGLRVAQGQGFQQTTPEQQTAFRNKVRADQMESDMPGVGSDDIRGGNLSSVPAQTELRRLAAEHDTGDESPVWWLPGVGGMSDANEQAFAETLQRDYGLSPQEAARVARQYANERRRVWPIFGGEWATRPPLPAQ